MGISEAETPTKSDKTSSPVQEQPTIHPYPDWAAMQAYYGPRVTMAPPYLTAAVASGHAPNPYIWAPQPFMPPYGVPYTAIYTHGVYTHPSVPLGTHSQGQGIAPFPSTNEAVVMATPLSVEPPAKSSGNKGRGLLKKLKGLDGLPMSNGDSNAENTSGGAVHGLSQSGESGTEGSSDGSDGSNESGENKSKRGISEDKPIAGKGGKAVRLENAVYAGETNESSYVPLEVSLATANIAGKPDERSLKRERRKQSNRESARRSRLRKQAETEELAIKVENLGTENMNLKTEIIQLKENSEKLRLENSALMEKLKNTQLSQAEESSSMKVVPQSLPPTTENFLSKVDNSSSFAARGGKQENDARGNSSVKLQLLRPNSRTDAVAAD